jgi:hypothetical protein
MRPTDGSIVYVSDCIASAPLMVRLLGGVIGTERVGSMVARSQ